MIVDPSGMLAQLLDAAIAERLASMHVAFPCKVISFNEDLGTAVVQPLYQFTDETPSPIQNVPVTGRKYRTDGGVIKRERHIVEVGDIVYVTCSDRQLKGAVAGEITTPSSSRSHDKNDAVIVGVLPCSL